MDAVLDACDCITTIKIENESFCTKFFIRNMAHFDFDGKKNKTFWALRDAWYRGEEEDHRAIIDLVLLIVGIRNGILIRTTNPDKMALLIECKLWHFETGQRLVQKRADFTGPDGATYMYVSTPPVIGNMASMILDGFSGTMSDTDLGLFLGYAHPMTPSRLIATSQDPFRLKFSLGAMLQCGDDPTSQKWYETWSEVIPHDYCREGLIAISERIRIIGPKMRLFANLLNAVTRSGKYVAFVAATVSVLVPDCEKFEWMKFTAVPGPSGDLAIDIIDLSNCRLIPRTIPTSDGFKVSGVSMPSLVR